MAILDPMAPAPRSPRDHSFHPLRIARVVRETADACSYVLDIPDELRTAFEYEAGQFCTFRVELDGEEQHRCYSMSSSPAVDAELAVTVKRVPGGLVSNWMNDNLAAGDLLETSVPAGVFCLPPGDGDVVAFGAGSGITPIFSILKTALATTTRRVHLLYANRDREATIFAAALAELAATHPDRLTVHHHLDVEQGFVDADAVRAVLDGIEAAEFFVCGPGPFMDIVEETLVERGVAGERIHIERFTPTETPPEDAAPDEGDAAEITVTIELGGRSGTTTHRAGTTILQVGRELGLSPPFSCESGECATCMARLVGGEVTMRVNNALLPDEVEEGWILTCQSVPTSPSVHVVYE
jgi:ferredoxin-NADP reductase